MRHCRNSQLLVVKCDLSSLPFKHGSLDAVFFSHVIEHLSNHEMVLSEFFRVLRSNGRLIVITPTEHPDFWRERGHVKAYTKEELAITLQKAGFEVLKTFYDKPFMLKMGDSELLMRVMNQSPFAWAKMNIILYARTRFHKLGF